MKNFIRHFQRESDGMWSCVSPAELETVQGRVQVATGTRFAPGTLFMGIDLVGMLEDELHRLNGHARPIISQSPQDSIHGPLRALASGKVTRGRKKRSLLEDRR